MRQKNFALAEKYFRMALRHEPSYLLPKLNLAFLHYTKYQCSMDQADVRRVELHALEVLAQHPNEHRIWILLAVAHMHMGKYTQAISDCKAALRLTHQHTPPCSSAQHRADTPLLLLIARIKYQMGHTQHALKILNSLPTNHQHYPHALFLKADIMRRSAETLSQSSFHSCCCAYSECMQMVANSSSALDRHLFQRCIDALVAIHVNHDPRSALRIASLESASMSHMAHIVLSLVSPPISSSQTSPTATKASLDLSHLLLSLSNTSPTPFSHSVSQITHANISFINFLNGQQSSSLHNLFKHLGVSSEVLQHPPHNALTTLSTLLHPLENESLIRLLWLLCVENDSPHTGLVFMNLIEHSPSPSTLFWVRMAQCETGSHAGLIDFSNWLFEINHADGFPLLLKVIAFLRSALPFSPQQAEFIKSSLEHLQILYPSLRIVNHEQCILALKTRDYSMIDHLLQTVDFSDSPTLTYLHSLLLYHKKNLLSMRQALSNLKKVDFLNNFRAHYLHLKILINVAQHQEFLSSFSQLKPITIEQRIKQEKIAFLFSLSNLHLRAAGQHLKTLQTLVKDQYMKWCTIYSIPRHCSKIEHLRSSLAYLEVKYYAMKHDWANLEKSLGAVTHKSQLDLFPYEVKLSSARGSIVPFLRSKASVITEFEEQREHHPQNIWIQIMLSLMEGGMQQQAKSLSFLGASVRFPRLDLLFDALKLAFVTHDSETLSALLKKINIDQLFSTREERNSYFVLTQIFRASSLLHEISSSLKLHVPEDTLTELSTRYKEIRSIMRNHLFPNLTECLASLGTISLEELLSDWVEIGQRLRLLLGSQMKSSVTWMEIYYDLGSERDRFAHIRLRVDKENLSLEDCLSALTTHFSDSETWKGVVFSDTLFHTISQLVSNGASIDDLPQSLPLSILFRMKSIDSRSMTALSTEVLCAGTSLYAAHYSWLQHLWHQADDSSIWNMLQLEADTQRMAERHDILSLNHSVPKCSSRSEFNSFIASATCALIKGNTVEEFEDAWQSWSSKSLYYSQQLILIYLQALSAETPVQIHDSKNSETVPGLMTNVPDFLQWIDENVATSLPSRCVEYHFSSSVSHSHAFHTSWRWNSDEIFSFLHDFDKTLKQLAFIFSSTGSADQSRVRLFAHWMQQLILCFHDENENDRWTKVLQFWYEVRMRNDDISRRYERLVQRSNSFAKDCFQDMSQILYFLSEKKIPSDRVCEVCVRGMLRLLPAGNIHNAYQRIFEPSRTSLSTWKETQDGILTYLLKVPDFCQQHIPLSNHRVWYQIRQMASTPPLQCFASVAVLLSAVLDLLIYSQDIDDDRSLQLVWNLIGQSKAETAHRVSDIAYMLWALTSSERTYYFSVTPFVRHPSSHTVPRPSIVTCCMSSLHDFMFSIGLLCDHFLEGSDDGTTRIQITNALLLRTQILDTLLKKKIIEWHNLLPRHSRYLARLMQVLHSGLIEIDSMLFSTFFSCPIEQHPQLLLEVAMTFRLKELHRFLWDHTKKLDATVMDAIIVFHQCSSNLSDQEYFTSSTEFNAQGEGKNELLRLLVPLFRSYLNAEVDFRETHQGLILHCSAHSRDGSPPFQYCYHQELSGESHLTSLRLVEELTLGQDVVQPCIPLALYLCLGSSVFALRPSGTSLLNVLSISRSMQPSHSQSTSILPWIESESSFLSLMSWQSRQIVGSPQDKKYQMITHHIFDNALYSRIKRLVVQYTQWRVIGWILGLKPRSASNTFLSIVGGGIYHTELYAGIEYAHHSNHLHDGIHSLMDSFPYLSEVYEEVLTRSFDVFLSQLDNVVHLMQSLRMERSSRGQKAEKTFFSNTEYDNLTNESYFPEIVAMGEQPEAHDRLRDDEFLNSMLRHHARLASLQRQEQQNVPPQEDMLDKSTHTKEEPIESNTPSLEMILHFVEKRIQELKATKTVKELII